MSVSSGWAAELELDDREPVSVGEHGERFGRYELKYELAAGGMGTVYLGRSTGPGGFDRPVAIKRIHPHLAHQKQLVDMFLDEARITGLITHPNVCTVYDFGEVDGTYYIALEYLMGESVASILRGLKGLRGDDEQAWYAMAAQLITNAAEGLHAAHTAKDARGRALDIVHRDVSPQNLLVTYDGVLKVLDFGVAQAKGRLHSTVAGSVKGKYAYMAPEQAAGKEVNARSDLWSLGVCLYEMLTRKRLFREKTEMDTILAVASRTIRSPRTVRSSIPVALEKIVMSLLQRDPEKRPKDARELGRMLTNYLHAQPKPTGPAAISEFMVKRFAGQKQRKADMVNTVLRTNPQSASQARIIPSKEVPLDVSQSMTQSMSQSMTQSLEMLREPTVTTPSGARGGLRAAEAIQAAQLASTPASSGAKPPAVPNDERRGAPTPLLGVPAVQIEAPPAISDSLSFDTMERKMLGRETEEESRRKWLWIGGALTILVFGLAFAFSGNSDEPPAPQQSAAETEVTPTPTPEPEVAVGEVDFGDDPSALESPPEENAPPEDALAGQEAAALAEAEQEGGAAQPATRPTMRRRPNRRPEENAVTMEVAETAMEEAPAEPGRVNVVTRGGWADVIFQGRRIGRTPLQFSLPPGLQTLELRPRGNPEGVRIPVQVRSGETSRVAYNLE